jgi:spoIIIJ-associated protein
MKQEFTSNSLRDALDQAAEVFKINVEEVQYRIITEKTKYFGHSQREIFIEAWTSEDTETGALETFVKQLIASMGLDLTFALTPQKEFVKIHFKGDDYKLMLYQNGNLLNAIQYLINRLYSEGMEKKIYCECENFRQKREQELTSMAHRCAKQVRSKGQPVELKEMNPFERRVIHMTINKYKDLVSESAGDDFQKVVTIRVKG